MSEQRNLTTAYFNEIAKDWFKRAYDPEDRLLLFPSGKVRQDIVISEMKRLKVGSLAIDLGCGSGQLVIELLKHRYEATGIDASPNMIAEARKALHRELPQADSSRIFQVGDVLNLNLEGQFNAVTAMGLLEYLEDELTFFRIVKKLLSNRGYALIECRNQLFNIGSGNRYTLEAAESGSLGKLISELDRVQNYSPVPIDEVPKIQVDVFTKIAETMSGEYKEANTIQYKTPIVEYPTKMLRKQHTPEGLEAILEKAELKLQYVVYYHCHPYLPRFEKAFPAMYNKIGLLMQPLGYTPLGATICSAFVAIIN